MVRYGPLTAVDELTFHAQHGEIVALLGPNGAGKTSTIEAVEGFRRPARGSVRVLGKDPVREGRRLAPDIGVMLQQGGVYPAMTPVEALELFASYYPRPNPPAALVERLGLGAAASTPWKRLSGGEQRLVSLALAVVGRPRVAFLDEPTAGVDPDGRAEVNTLIRELASSGTCVMLATHDLDEAEDLADRPQEIRFTTAPGLDKASLAKVMGGTVTESTPGRYRLIGEADPDRIATLATWLAARGTLLLELSAGGESLREAYARLVHRRSP